MLRRFGALLADEFGEHFVERGWFQSDLDHRAGSERLGDGRCHVDYVYFVELIAEVATDLRCKKDKSAPYLSSLWSCRCRGVLG